MKVDVVAAHPAIWIKFWFFELNECAAHVHSTFRILHLIFYSPFCVVAIGIPLVRFCKWVNQNEIQKANDGSDKP
jgi:hypothetical protein